MNYHIGRLFLSSLYVWSFGVAGFSHTKAPNTQRTEKKTTDVVIHQHSRKLLMMDILMSESYWAHKKWNNIASDIKLVFHSSTSVCVLYIFSHHIHNMLRPSVNCNIFCRTYLPFPILLTKYKIMIEWFLLKMITGMVGTLWGYVMDLLHRYLALYFQDWRPSACTLLYLRLSEKKREGVPKNLHTVCKAFVCICWQMRWTVPLSIYVRQSYRPVNCNKVWYSNYIHRRHVITCSFSV